MISVPSDEKVVAKSKNSVAIQNEKSNQTLTKNLVSDANDIEEKSKIPVLSEKDLKRGFYYVQVASFSELKKAENLCEKYPKYPLQIVKVGKYYRVLVGELTIDEKGAMLEKFQSFGFRDAFVRKIK